MIIVPQSRYRKPRDQRRRQQPNDQKKLAVISYLVSISPKGATKTGISRKASILSQAGDEFDEFMIQLEGIEWVKRKESESVGGYDNFFVTEKGREALNLAKQLEREGHPLAKLDGIQGVGDF